MLTLHSTESSFTVHREGFFNTIGQKGQINDVCDEAA
jgi:hypothetical protein